MTTTAPRRAAGLSQSDPATAAELLVEQGTAFATELRQLSWKDWSRPTDCPSWDVREVAAHVAGALEESARLHVLLRHLLKAARRSAGTAQVDAINDLQVRDRAHASGQAIAAEIARLAPRAARVRRRVPDVVRRRASGSDDLPPGATFGYIFDVIYIRDLWMHRVDVARATGRSMLPTTGEREVVAQVVRDLDRFTSGGPAWVLELTGDGSYPGGGPWQLGDGEALATVRADTVAYLRLLSGRAGEVDLDVTGDPSVREHALAARVIF